MFAEINEQMDTIKRGVVELLHESELERKLLNSQKLNKPLIVKLGCDPTRPDLHLGHSVVLRKMRQFQDLGHQAVLIVGDFTAMIGDPNGKNISRSALSLSESRENGKSYFDQAAKILDLHKILIVYNSEWLARMTFEKVIRLASTYTVAQMLEHEDFKNRFNQAQGISIHEFLYPLAQAMDSVSIQADVELGGTDQTFNLLVGREVQCAYGQQPQVILTMPILRGIDGGMKMSKSLDNYIGITDSPNQMYGKTLSIPDNLIYEYFNLTTSASDRDLSDILKTIEDPAKNPRDLKRRLARELVTLYHCPDDALKAEENFDALFIRKKIPD